MEARRQSDENPNSNVVAETMKFLTSSSHGYQIIDWSRRSMTKYLSAKKTHAAINSKLFMKLEHVNNAFYEFELAEAQTELKEPIVVGLPILQYAKLRLLDLQYNFFTKFCEINKFEELEGRTTSLYLALAEKELEDCIRPEMKAEWEQLRSKDCTDSFIAAAVGSFLRRLCCDKHKKHEKREPHLFQEFRFSERLCICSQTYCCYEKTSNKLQLSIEGLSD